MPPVDQPSHCRHRWAQSLSLLGAFLVSCALANPASARRFPNVVIITVDTLRADHLSSYGYTRQTTPNIDQILAEGVRFTNARTVVPLTNPALSSMITSRYPHEHGATRNGLTMRPELPSFVKQLGQRGFATAAFVGNWTLKDELSGLGEHFDEYHEVFTRKRWLVMKGEATAEDITQRAHDWLHRQVKDAPDQPFLLWVHYVEPHTPYRTHQSVLRQLGLPRSGADLPALDRYDSEIAFVDRSIGRLVDEIDTLVPGEDTLLVFTADHGESLGEHRYWGHGRNLHEPGLHIPMGLRWKQRLTPGVVEEPTTLLDVGPTVLGLMGYPMDDGYRGWDLSQRLAEGESPAELRERTTFLQAHKGAVQGIEDQQKARQRGLLQLGLIREGIKEVLRLPSQLMLFDLDKDPGEQQRQEIGLQPSAELASWQSTIQQGLVGADSLPVPELGELGEEQMRSLGYLK